MKKYGNPMDQLYMWLRERVTEEVMIEGQRFGVVMDEQVIGLVQLGEVVNRTIRSVRGYIRELENRGMIQRRRTPYGYAFLVNTLDYALYDQQRFQKTTEGKERGSRAEAEGKERGSRAETEGEVRGNRAEAEGKVRGSREEVEGKERGSRAEAEGKVKGIKPEQKDLYILKNKELKESIKNIYVSFSSLTSVKLMMDKKDEICIKGLLEEGLTQKQMIAWVKVEYERIQQKECKNIVVFRYFESYLRQRYKRELVRLARLREEPEQVKIQRQWQAEAADRDFVRKLLQEVNGNV